MVPGFNTDFKYRGETYHIQTEDNGLGNPVVVTLLYHKGAILASRRTSYRDLAAKPGYEQELMGLMKSQHKDLMRALLAGALDKDGTAPAAVGGTGEHPADAAAAVAAARPAPQPQRDQGAEAGRRAVPIAAAPKAPPGPSVPAVEPRLAQLTLDEAIRRYLEQFAATAAVGAR
jgi:hypothetical protein